jgi:acetyl esterase/lipase
MKAVLDSLQSLHPLPIAKLKPREARLQPGAADAVKHLLIKQGRSTAPEPVASVADVTVPGPPGAPDVKVRLYKPLRAPAGPLPVIMYFHGGGFVIASVAAYDSSYRAMANRTGAMVAAVAYRYAPEHRLPAAHEDSYAATQYFLNNAEKFGGNSSKVAVMGESAGGNLATDMCIMAKLRGGKMPVHQTLIYPFVNDKILASHRAYARAKPLDTPGVKWFLTYAPPLSKAKQKEIAALLTPLYAPDSLIKGLPPATVVAAEIDPLQTEGQLYALKLRQNGVRTSYRLYPGVTHEFFGMRAVLNKAQDAENFAASELKAAFAR